MTLRDRPVGLPKLFMNVFTDCRLLVILISKPRDVEMKRTETVSA